jgi:hypothetical protein
MANKKTIKDYFNEIIELAKENGRDDLVTFCEDRIEKLGRKTASGDRKPTKKQVENEGIKDIILEVLADLENPATVSEIMTDGRIEISSQKLTTLLTQLRKAEKVVRTEEKGKAYYSLA